MTMRVKERLLGLMLRKAIKRGKRMPYYDIYVAPEPGLTPELYMQRTWVIGGSSQDDERPDHVPPRTWKGAWPDWLIGKLFSCRLHHTHRSDQDRDLHDHPSWSVSVVLKGGYYELTPVDQRQHPALDSVRHNVRWHGPGAIVFRRRHHRHRLIIPDDQTSWSLFFRGRTPKGWDWGFYTPEGKVPWREYLGLEDAA